MQRSTGNTGADIQRAEHSEEQVRVYELYRENNQASWTMELRIVTGISSES